jgi:hypothetical protein
MNRIQRARNVLLLLLTAFIVALVALGCSRSGEASSDDADAYRNSTGGPARMTLGADTESVAPGATARAPHTGAMADPCMLFGNVERALDTITSSAGALLRGEDSCVIAMIDSLVGRFVASGDERYLVAIDSCWSNSDGYVSDYLTEVADTLFAKRADGFAGYMSKHREPAAPIEELLVHAWRLRVDGRSDSVQIKRDIASDARRHIAEEHIAGERRAAVERALRDAGIAQQ